jgi:hypothetical protein
MTSSIVLDGSVIILMIRPAAAIKDFEKYTNNTFNYKHLPHSFIKRHVSIWYRIY